MSRSDEAAVRACYATWSKDYHAKYYGGKASYRPVHRDLLRKLLKQSGARTVLDAGCGPASFLRYVARDHDVHGFDLTPEMVVEARRVLARRGLPAERVWEGSVLDRRSFRPPGSKASFTFDAAVCAGVFPHIPEDQDDVVIENLRRSVKKGGLVVLEARNELFALFTLNRYSHAFFLDQLIRAPSLVGKAGRERGKVEAALRELEARFRMDLPPVRRGKKGEPGYDEVLSRTHNPLVLERRFARAGFTSVRLLFYHYHCLPPMLGGAVPELFGRESLAMEDPDDWRGHFMASAFLLAGTRV